ncbi:hypothetical protein GW796_07730 [archaeon]|nr:hypothetical protein [archaeon]
MNNQLFWILLVLVVGIVVLMKFMSVIVSLALVGGAIIFLYIKRKECFNMFKKLLNK